MARILIIDDIEGIRHFLRLILEREGHVVEEAANGAEAVRADRRNPADLAFCDLFMPEKEGLETIADLRQQHPGLPVIAMSGGNPKLGMDFLPLARRMGATRTLPKPFTGGQALEAVASVLGATSPA